MGESTGNLAGERGVGQVLSEPVKITSLDVTIAVSVMGMLRTVYLNQGQSVVVGPGLLSMRQAGAGFEHARYKMEPVEGDDALEG